MKYSINKWSWKNKDALVLAFNVCGKKEAFLVLWQMPPAHIKFWQTRLHAWWRRRQMFTASHAGFLVSLLTDAKNLKLGAAGSWIEWGKSCSEPPRALKGSWEVSACGSEGETHDWDNCLTFPFTLVASMHDSHNTSVPAAAVFFPLSSPSASH